MNLKRYFLLLLVLLQVTTLYSQSLKVLGTIKDTDGKPVPAVNVLIKPGDLGTFTDDAGQFELTVSHTDNLTITFSHIRYQDQSVNYAIQPDQTQLTIDLKMALDIQYLEGVKVTDDQEDLSIREEVSVYKINPKSASVLPSPFGDFNKILNTLPGVVGNNELSSTYAVRGGNFDENLVYVNDILIYRPFLIRAGQQEGLSFINPDLVASVEFSAGGWQPKYGDKLSSSLNIQYKKPEESAASISLGLLGGNAHFEGTNRKKNISYIFGARHKSAAYLLETQETQGGYRPRFTDIQSFINFDLSDDGSKDTELGVLFSYARNRYQVVPETRETTFGVINQSLRLLVAFDGRETLRYDLWQGGLKLTHRFNDKFTSKFMSSAMRSGEREYFDVEGGYLLCDVNNNPGTNNFNECVSVRGIGTNYDYGRNKLEATIYNLENRNVYRPGNRSVIEFGFGYSRQEIEDEIDEYSFIDSSDFVTITRTLNTQLELNTNIATAYLQHTFYIDDQQTVTYGARLNYRDVNDQLLISPRLQYSIKPAWRRDILFKAALGIYQQPPFYRELRDFGGNLNENLKAQTSVHFIAGMDYNFKLWGRDFKFLSEGYYKKLSNVIAYDLDNVKIRYYANNRTDAYAMGVDFRVSGEFIPGTESWFSLGLLNTREDLEDDNKGSVRRPSDQHINLAIFFQDHLPNDPTIRVNLNLLFGSGLPFGPPNDINDRTVFIGRAYRRVDIGFSKIITLKNKLLKSLWLGLDVLNLLGTNNTISYTWVQDFSGIEYGVPNNLSQRFFNAKVHARF
ncbi:TonB-dependent receptor [Fulvivirgaceae bacterium BMA12]|uniref:TonB-dependent receptor n=1 Tax=Agaribacillus aureus TaxID=3051825 RepID=A0ABT8L0R5_9BACT|nr:TonB-dependent receptor [Fulvivirgaceae bacterium BMA12]